MHINNFGRSQRTREVSEEKRDWSMSGAGKTIVICLGGKKNLAIAFKLYLENNPR